MIWKLKRRRAASTDGRSTVIDGSPELDGKDSSSGSVLLNGKFGGKVLITRSLIVGEKGVVNANIHAEWVVVRGEVVGNVCASERVELKEGARVIGDVQAPVVVMERGVTFEGQCGMAKPAPHGWARVVGRGVNLLRRGAWYPVVDDGPTNVVVLNVARQSVAVERSVIEMRHDRPERWSVVVRSEDEPRPNSRTALDLGPVYGVCPSCSKRAALAGRPDLRECPHCRREFAVAWDEAC